MAAGTTDPGPSDPVITAGGVSGGHRTWTTSAEVRRWEQDQGDAGIPHCCHRINEQQTGQL